MWIIYDALDEVITDDSAMMVGLHLMRHVAIDEVESVEEQDSIVRTHLTEGQRRCSERCADEEV